MAIQGDYKMNQAEAIQELKKKQEDLAKLRDRFLDLADEIDAQLDSVDRAYAAFEDAINALSELV